MTPAEQLITELCEPGSKSLNALEPGLRRRLLQALMASLVNIDPTEDLEDLLPLDHPIDWHKDESTGKLRIRFPYQISQHRDELHYRIVELTPRAQHALIGICAGSVAADETAGRNRTPEPPTIQ